MKITEVITALGHRNIKAAHKTTFEITKEKELSTRGDCIIAVSADKGFPDLRTEFKRLLCSENAKLTIFINASGTVDVVHAIGNPKLILAHPMDMVVRKSNYICDRTLAICADKAACDLSRELVEKLKNQSKW